MKVDESSGGVCIWLDDKRGGRGFISFFFFFLFRGFGAEELKCFTFSYILKSAMIALAFRWGFAGKKGPIHLWAFYG